jgi:hypothetical protein
MNLLGSMRETIRDPYFAVIKTDALKAVEWFAGHLSKYVKWIWWRQSSFCASDRGDQSQEHAVVSHVRIRRSEHGFMQKVSVQLDFLQRILESHWTENLIYVFSRNETEWPRSQFYIRAIYIFPGLPIWLQQNRQTDPGNRSLMQECGNWQTEHNSVLEITRQRSFISRKT